MYGAICVPGFPDGTDRITVSAAIESLRPQLREYGVRRDVTARCERYLTGAPRKRPEHAVQRACERRDASVSRETASEGPSPAQLTELRLLYT